MFRITMSVAALLAMLIVSSTALAHPGHSLRKQTAASAHNEQSQTDAEDHAERDVLAVNDLPLLLAQVDQKKARPDGDKAPDMAKPFAAFVKLKAINTHWDDRYFYVESTGIPDHRLAAAGAVAAEVCR